MTEKEKQVIDLVKDINSINKQLSLFIREETIDALLSVKSHLLVESISFEASNNTKLTSIYNLEDDVLKSKLIPYKNICLMKLLEIIGKDETNKIIQKYNL